MKTYILFFLLISASCSNKSYKKFSYEKSKNPWIDAFKDQVFFFSLKESYKNDTIFQLIEKKDAFNPYDGLSIEAVNIAKDLGRQLVKKMPPPSMCEGCKNGENYYMANALHYYNSKELDSIAKAQYKIHIKEDEKLWGKRLLK